MEDRGETTAFAVVQSLTGWWELAGLDSAVSDESVNWLADETPEKAPSATTIAAAAKKLDEQPAAPSIVWPMDLMMLCEMVQSGAPLPGNSYGPVRFAPVGSHICEVMVISDLPDISDAQEVQEVQVSANASLLHRMLAAVGVDSANTFRTWLATTIPSTGEVPERDLPELAAFMLHQIKLIRPKSIVILGSSACMALLGEELMNARAELRNINHDGLNIPTLTTFHPRTLIAQPATKKQAWKDLQMFAKRAVQ